MNELDQVCEMFYIGIYTLMTSLTKGSANVHQCVVIASLKWPSVPFLRMFERIRVY